MPLLGGSVAPGISLAPSSHDYGSVPVGSANTTVFTVTNDGSAPLAVGTTEFAGSDAREFAVVSGGGPFSLAPGESRAITVRFSPASTGAKNATLEVGSNDPDAPVVSASVSGSGVASTIAVDPASLDFGDVANDGEGTRTITVTNDGSAPLSVTDTAITGANAGEFDIVAGGGAFTLEPGESREITVAFAPTTTGAKQAQLVIESDDADQPTLTVPLSGTSVASAIDLTPDTYAYGAIPTGSGETAVFRVRNDGSAPLSVTDTAITGANAGEFTIIEGGGAFTLAPGESRAITVEFTPTVTGEATADLVIASDDPNQPTVTVPLLGESVEPNVALAPSSNDYGSVPVGSANTTVFEVRNDGNAPLSVTDTAITGANAGEFAIVSGGGAFTLAPDESRQIIVAFSPESTGARSATLELRNNDPDSPTVRSSLSGTGIQSNIVANPVTLRYGDVPNDGRTTRTVSLTNDGDAPLEVTDTTITGVDAGAFTITDGGGTFTLDPGQSQTITVEFATATTGEKTAQLVIESDAANQPTLTVPLSGTGIAPSIALTPTTADYGGVPVDSGDTRTFTVTNDGTAALDVSEVSIAGADADQFSIIGGGGSFTVERGQSRVITVKFAPGSTGAKSAILQVRSNDPVQPTVVGSLSGRGTQSNIVVEPASVEYGETATGSNTPRVVTVTNDGDAPLTVSGASLAGADAGAFRITSGGGTFTLAPDESREITVEFRPTESGLKSAQIVIESDAANQPTLTVPLSGSATVVQCNTQVTGVSAPSSVEQGEDATISATITNDGRANGCGGTATLDVAGQGAAKTDIVFLIDDSGSMDPYIEEVRDNIEQFNDQLEDEGIDARYAVVTFGKGSTNVRQGYTDKTNKVRNALGKISTGGGVERNYRAISDSLTRTDLSPRADAKTVLIDITDEDTDRYSSDPTQDQLVNLIDSRNAKFISVSADVDYITAFNRRYGQPYSASLDPHVLAQRVEEGAWFDLLDNANFVTDVRNEVVTTVNTVETQETTVDLDAGESRQASFTIDTSQFAAGTTITYSVSINGNTRTGEITVN